MSSDSEILDFASEDRPQRSTGLNILTILTIIGSILSILFAVYGYMTVQQTYVTMRENFESGKFEKVPGFMKGMMNAEAVERMQKMYENRMPIAILSLVAAILCLYGAIEMRKLKKQGYIFYVIGELLPVLTAVLFIGVGSFSGLGLISLIIPVVFLILYTIYRKDLVY